MSAIYMMSQELFEYIGMRYAIPEPQLYGISLAMVTALGVHIINDANRFMGERREVLHKSSIAQTVVALTSTGAIILLCKTKIDKCLGLLVSCALACGAGAYYKRPLNEAFVVSLLLTGPPILFHTYCSSI